MPGWQQGQAPADTQGWSPCAPRGTSLIPCQASQCQGGWAGESRRRMAEPAGTAEEQILLGPLGAVPAPDQCRLCAGSWWLPCVHRDWRVAGPVPAPAGQWARPAGTALGTRAAQTSLGAGYMSPSDCWAPKQPGGSLVGCCVPPQGSPALQSRAPCCMAILHRSHPALPALPPWGTTELLQLEKRLPRHAPCLLPHGGECILHTALG